MRKGDIVKLKSYKGYSDYISHRGRLAKVMGRDTGDEDLPWRIRWEKERTESYVSANNVITVKPKGEQDIKEIVKKFIRKETNGL